MTTIPINMSQRLPKHEIKELSSERFEVTITPPSWSGFKPSTMILNRDQKDRLEKWLGDRSLYIQDVFPEMSRNDRETLLSGISPDQWSAFEDDE